MDDLVPMPTGMQALGRRIRNIERKVYSLGGRISEHLTIGKGGINIKDGGSLTVTGNLILKEGIIDGKALKNQLEPASFHTATLRGLPGAGSWNTLAWVEVTKPAWATRVIILASYGGTLNTATDVIGGLADVGTRVKVTNGQTSPEVLASVFNMGVRNVSGSHAVTAPASTPKTRISVEGQTGNTSGLYTTDGSRIQLSGIAIWMR